MCRDRIALQGQIIEVVFFVQEDKQGAQKLGKLLDVMLLTEEHKLRFVTLAGQELHAGPRQFAGVENHRVAAMAKGISQDVPLFTRVGRWLGVLAGRAREKNREEQR